MACRGIMVNYLFGEDESSFNPAVDRRQQNGVVMEFERFFKFSQLLLRDEFVLSY